MVNVHSLVSPIQTFTAKAPPPTSTDANQPNLSVFQSLKKKKKFHVQERKVNFDKDQIAMARRLG